MRQYIPDKGLLPPLPVNVTVRPLSTVEYTRYARVFHCRQWSN